MTGPATHKWLARLRRTPLHPQWLLGPQRPPPGIERAVGRLLDIGAAHRWLQDCLPEEVHYVALDYPATGRDIYGACPDIFADAAHLPLADGAFDGVACLEVLEHVKEPRRVVAEIARVLRPGGSAWISMPFLYPVHDAPHDYQRYTEDGLRRDLEEAGLELVTLHRSVGALRTVGLLAALAVAGGLRGRGLLAVFLAPIAAAAVLAINLAALAASWVWPDWHSISAGYSIQARKP